MKVSDLIAELQTLNPNAELRVHTDEQDMCFRVTGAWKQDRVVYIGTDQIDEDEEEDGEDEEGPYEFENERDYD